MIITRHAVKQYKERILLNPYLDDEKVKLNILEIFQRSRYISDNGKGILFRNEDLLIEFIVKNCKIITLFPIQKRG